MKDPATLSKMAGFHLFPAHDNLYSHEMRKGLKECEIVRSITYSNLTLGITQTSLSTRMDRLHSLRWWNGWMANAQLYLTVDEPHRQTIERGSRASVESVVPLVYS